MPSSVHNASDKIAISTILGVVSVSGGGGGIQYPIDSTTIAATGTGTLVLGIQSGATTARGLALSTTGGLIIASMPAVGAGAQYPVDSTALGATGTGTLILGVQSGATTARGLAVTVTGGIFNVQNIGTITTLLGTVAVSGGGGGTQYPVDSTSMNNTGTGTLILGMQSGGTTARGIAVTTTGAQHVSVQNILSASGVTIASITTGTVSVVNVLSASGVTVASLTTGTVNVVNVLSASGVTIASLTTGTVNISAGTITTLLGTVAVSGGGGGVQYPIGDTAVAATGTGTLVIGLQSGATTARGLAITTTGAAHVAVQGNLVVSSITTGTLSVINVLSASGVTIASVTTGTVSVVNVLSASGVTIASITTGTVNVVNVLSATGVMVATVTTLLGVVAVSGGGGGVQYQVDTTAMAITGTGTLILGMQSGATTARGVALTISGQPLVTLTTGTARAGSFLTTANPTRFQAIAVSVTSAAAGTIVQASGAHTLCIKNVNIAASGAGLFVLASDATAMLRVYIGATQSFAQQFLEPLCCTSAQSFRIIAPSASSHHITVVGYTVT